MKWGDMEIAVGRFKIAEFAAAGLGGDRAKILSFQLCVL